MSKFKKGVNLTDLQIERGVFPKMWINTEKEKMIISYKENYNDEIKEYEINNTKQFVSKTITEDYTISPDDVGKLLVVDNINTPIIITIDDSDVENFRLGDSIYIAFKEDHHKINHGYLDLKLLAKSNTHSFEILEYKVHKNGNYGYEVWIPMTTIFETGNPDEFETFMRKIINTI